MGWLSCDISPELFLSAFVTLTSIFIIKDNDWAIGDGPGAMGKADSGL
jgi:hypothetical protein